MKRKFIIRNIIILVILIGVITGVSYYFIEQNKKVEEVELQEGSLKDLGNGRLEFKAKYNEGTINVKVDKDKVIIDE